MDKTMVVLELINPKIETVALSNRSVVDVSDVSPKENVKIPKRK